MDQPEDAEPVATVHYGNRRWRIPRGSELTFGRGAGCEVLLPPDDLISRRAGSLEALADCVLIRNHSASKPLMLQPNVGAVQVIAPGHAATSLGHPDFDLLVQATGGPLHLTVDARALRVPGRDPEQGSPTEKAPFKVTPAQSRMLVELCRPMVEGRTPSPAPATYPQIAARLGRSPGHVRNVLADLRVRLTAAGVAELAREPFAVGAEENHGDGHEDFRRALAEWAIWSGFATGREET